MTTNRRELRGHSCQPGRVYARALLLLSIVMASVRPIWAETLTERGIYVVEAIAGCGSCHTPRMSDGNPDVARAFSGGYVITSPTFRAVVPNITPDPETGIGTWSENQIADALRSGRRPDGSIIGPPMQIGAYRNMSDSDLSSVIAYLRQLKPVENHVERSTYDTPLPASYGPPVGSIPDADRSNKIVYGRYLAATLGDCTNCHTPSNKGRPDLTRLGAGGREMAVEGGGVITTPNLTPANMNGIVGWTDAEVKTLIRQGVRPDGSALVKLMPIEIYQKLSDSDLDAIVAFLRSLKPAT